MADIVLKVSEDVLKSKVGEIQKQIGNLEKDWEKISQLIQKSKNYWIGEASEEHQKYRKDIEEDVQTVLKRLKEHPADLLEMAEIYQDTEQKIVQLTAALPDNVIS